MKDSTVPRSSWMHESLKSQKRSNSRGLWVLQYSEARFLPSVSSATSRTKHISWRSGIRFKQIVKAASHLIDDWAMLMEASRRKTDPMRIVWNDSRIGKTVPPQKERRLLDEHEGETMVLRLTQYLQWRKGYSFGKEKWWANRILWRMDPNGTGNCYHLDGWGKIVLTTTDRSDPTTAMCNCPECKLSNPVWDASCQAKVCEGMNPDTVRTRQRVPSSMREKFLGSSSIVYTGTCLPRVLVKRHIIFQGCQVSFNGSLPHR